MLDENNAKLTPPFHAVIFMSQRTPGDNGYGDVSAKMAAMAKEQPGYLGMESARAPDGKGITIAFFESEEAIRNWGRVAEHREAQASGRAEWYDAFQIYYTRVERVKAWTKRHTEQGDGA